MPDFLVADDDPTICAILVRHLQQWYPACNVEVVTSARDVAAWCALVSFDVLILEFDLPRFAAYLLSDAWREVAQRTPVLMLLAHELDAPEARACGATATLAKPFTPCDLRAALDSLLTQPPSR